MKSLKNLTGDSLEQLIDYNVVDQNGDEIGTLHSLWSDPDTGAVEFLGVKTGWIFGQNHVVPAGKAELDEATNVVRLPYTEAFIKEAPAISADAEISEAEETEIYRYYGMGREENTSTGEAGATGEGFYIGTSAGDLPEAAGAAALADASSVGDGASQFGAPTTGSTLRDDANAASRWRRTSRPTDAGTTATGSIGTDITSAVSTSNAAGTAGGLEVNAVGTSGTSSAGEAVRSALDSLSPSDSSGTRTPLTAATPGSFGTANLYGSTGTTSPVSADALGTSMETEPAGHGETSAADSDKVTPTSTGVREEGNKNLDPITGEPGAHPVGTGVGALGAGAAGAALGGAVGGPIGAPIGAVVGTIIGAVGGGLVGKGIAESINPTEENDYWQSHYRNASYFQNDYEYSDYAPAYKTGYEGYKKYADSGRDYADAESDLKRDYEQSKGDSRLEWEKAKSATRDAWDRLKAKASDATK